MQLHEWTYNFVSAEDVIQSSPIKHFKGWINQDACAKFKASNLWLDLSTTEFHVYLQLLN